MRICVRECVCGRESVCKTKKKSVIIWMRWMNLLDTFAVYWLCVLLRFYIEHYQPTFPPIMYSFKCDLVKQIVVHADIAHYTVNLLLACSKSHTFSAPERDPAITISSAWPKRTASMLVVWPVRLCDQQTQFEQYSGTFGNVQLPDNIHFFFFIKDFSIYRIKLEIIITM